MSISKKDLKMSLTMSLITTFFVTLTLVSVNAGFTDRFIFIWLRSWFIAFIIASLSSVFIAPIVRKKIY